MQEDTIYPQDNITLWTSSALYGATDGWTQNCMVSLAGWLVTIMIRCVIKSALVVARGEVLKDVMDLLLLLLFLLLVLVQLSCDRPTCVQLVGQFREAQTLNRK